MIFFKDILTILQENNESFSFNEKNKISFKNHKKKLFKIFYLLIKN